MKIKNIFGLLALVFMSVSIQGAEFEQREEVLITHVQQSIEKAWQESSQLPEELLLISGMSSSKVRHLLNNLCSLPNTNYLEIGVWRGSTWLAALFGNEATISSAVAIDNWSEFGGPMAEFISNCDQFLPQFPFSFYSADCFCLDVKSVCKTGVNIYFYDGNHTEISQERAFTYYDGILDDLFIAVVDDWNHPPVPIGTYSAFEKLRYTILYETALPAKFNGDIENWWNGLYVAVIRKSR